MIDGEEVQAKTREMERERKARWKANPERELECTRDRENNVSLLCSLFFGFWFYEFSNCVYEGF